MKNEMSDIVGVIPAAGNATRISPIPCSKEIFPVGVNSENGEPKIKVAADYLLESFCEAGADQVYMIIRKEKWDIPQYLGLGTKAVNSLAYIVTDPTQGTHHTIDLAYRFVKNKMILLGFPDIIFKPRNAFVALLEKQEQTGAEVVMGLFNTTNPRKADMVDIDDQGRVKSIVIKPKQTSLIYTWAIAAWTAKFTEYLHDYIANDGDKEESRSGEAKEIFIGNVFQDAMLHGMNIETVYFPDGKFVDIGTFSDLEKVLNKEF